MKLFLKSMLCVAAFFAFSAIAIGQQDKTTRPSPPAIAKGTVQGANITVNYSSPSVKGRKIWG